MRILHVYAGGGEIYGAERVIYNLALEHIKRNIDVNIAFLRRGENSSFLDLLINRHIPVLEINSRGRLDIQAFMRLKAICQDLSPQILHSHGYKGDIFTALLKRVLKKPIIISTKHGSTDSSPKIKFYNYLGDLSLRFFDRVVAVSNSTKVKLIQQRIPANKIDVITNGVDLSMLAQIRKGRLRNELKLGSDCKLIGFIGRLDREKGISYLLEAARVVCRKSEEVYFVLIGDGELKEEVRSFVSLNKLDSRVLMLGWRKNSEELIADLDIVSLPSLTEGTPMVLLESMALGVPVIVSDVGGVSEMIDNLRTGLLINPRDTKALIDSIYLLLEDRELAKKISHNSIEQVRTKFSSYHMAEMYIRTYSLLLNGETLS